MILVSARDVKIVSVYIISGAGIHLRLILVTATILTTDKDY